MDPLTVLNAIEIPSPCSADWSAMPGDDRKRFCQGCQKHVHNLSALTAAEASELVSSDPVLPCIRLSRGADGTVVTAERRRPRLARLAAGVLVGFSAAGSGGCAGESPAALTRPGWAQSVLDYFWPPAQITAGVMVLSGTPSPAPVPPPAPAPGSFRMGEPCAVPALPPMLGKPVTTQPDELPDNPFAPE